MAFLSSSLEGPAWRSEPKTIPFLVPLCRGRVEIRVEGDSVLSSSTGAKRSGEVAGQLVGSPEGETNPYEVAV
jgi:hypothetical protein